jgi:nucleoside-diphosphate-sugar epimerase
MVGDTSKIRRELGYRETVSAEEAMARTVAWERANPPEQSEAT